MSTRSSVYYEEDGVHIFEDFVYPEVRLFLEYQQGPFCLTLPLSDALSDVIIRGLEKK